jgi:CRISPR-associated protein Cas1
MEVTIPNTQWKKHGYSKVTLNYMKKNAESEKPFSLNNHVRERLNQWNSVIDEIM